MAEARSLADCLIATGRLEPAQTARASRRRSTSGDRRSRRTSRTSVTGGRSWAQRTHGHRRRTHQRLHPGNDGRRRRHRRLRQRRMAGHLPGQRRAPVGSRDRRRTCEPSVSQQRRRHVRRRDEQAGLGGRGWGQGVCGRRLRQRRSHRPVRRPTTGITFSIATTATARSAMRRARAVCPSPARAGARGPPFWTSTGTATWTCSSRPTSPTRMPLRYAPGSRKDCFWKGLGVMCGPSG